MYMDAFLIEALARDRAEQLRAEARRRAARRSAHGVRPRHAILRWLPPLRLPAERSRAGA